MKKCPHCGKEIEENIVREWRKTFVEGGVLEEITNLPGARKNALGQLYKTVYGGPLLVIVSKDEE